MDGSNTALLPRNLQRETRYSEFVPCVSIVKHRPELIELGDEMNAGPGQIDRSQGRYTGAYRDIYALSYIVPDAVLKKMPAERGRQRRMGGWSIRTEPVDGTAVHMVDALRSNRGVLSEMRERASVLLSGWLRLDRRSRADAMLLENPRGPVPTIWERAHHALIPRIPASHAVVAPVHFCHVGDQYPHDAVSEFERFAV